MLIYNITFLIECKAEPAWLLWMKEIYIKKILESHCFTKHQLVRLLDVADDEGPTYALQLYAGSLTEYRAYISHFHLPMEALRYEKWKNKVLSFSTLMEVID